VGAHILQEGSAGVVCHLTISPAVFLVMLQAGDHCTHWVQQARQAILWQQVSRKAMSDYQLNCKRKESSLMTYPQAVQKLHKPNTS
jgi:hypothetical protein